jgi:hypothetical protein
MTLYFACITMGLFFIQHCCFELTLFLLFRFVPFAKQKMAPLNIPIANFTKRTFLASDEEMALRCGGKGLLRVAFQITV